MKVTNITKSSLGVSFNGKFKGMRKEQSFSVYPKGTDNDESKVIIQSDTRIGYYTLGENKIQLCKPQACGAYFVHLSMCPVDVETIISDEEAKELTEMIG